MIEHALTLKEAAELLGVSYSTVYAHKAQMGFFQIGNQWRVWPEKLKSATELQSQPTGADGTKEKTCHSESAKGRISGTSISANQAVDALDRRLGQPTERRLRSITTG